jgi:hypothetical protein
MHTTSRTLLKGLGPLQKLVRAIGEGDVMTHMNVSLDLRLS